MPPDHGEALISRLHNMACPPAIVLLLENTAWLQVNGFPLDRVDVVIRTVSFGSGVLIEALQALSLGRRYVGPALLTILKASTRPEQPQLTPREHDTLYELAKGLTNREIAQRLGIAATTTREYTRNRTVALSLALKLGLLSSSEHDGTLQDGPARLR